MRRLQFHHTDGGDEEEQESRVADEQSSVNSSHVDAAALWLHTENNIS